MIGPLTRKLAKMVLASKTPDVDTKVLAPNAFSLFRIKREALSTVLPVNVLLPDSVMLAVPVLMSEALPAKDPPNVNALLPAPTVKLAPKITVPVPVIVSMASALATL